MGRRLSTGEIAAIAQVLNEGGSFFDAMSVVNWRGALEPFKASVEREGWHLVRVLVQIEKSRYFSRLPTLTLAQIALITEVFLRPHSVEAALGLFAERIGRHCSTLSRLTATLKRSGFAMRCGIMDDTRWNQEIRKVVALRERLEQHE